MGFLRDAYMSSVFSEPIDEKRFLAKAAIDYLPQSGVVGLGSGSTVNEFISVFSRVKDNFDLSFVPGSFQTEFHLLNAGLHVVSLREFPKLELVIDGADQFTSEKALLKGGGGALFKEKILAANTKQYLILAGRKKFVDQLGSRGTPIPIEVSPFGVSSFVSHIVQRFSSQLKAQIRVESNRNNPFLTEHGNFIVDLYFSRPIDDPASFDKDLKLARPEVLCTGIFAGFSPVILTTATDDSNVLVKL